MTSDITHHRSTYEALQAIRDSLGYLAAEAERDDLPEAAEAIREALDKIEGEMRARLV